MQPWSVSKTPALHAQKPFAKQKSTEILQRLKSPKSWHFISNLLEVNLVNLALQTEGIAAYGRSQRWQHALTLFYDLSESKIGFRLDAVVLSALVSSLERGLRWSFTLQVLRRSAPVGTLTPRGLTSSAAACAKQSEWTWALQLHASGQPSVQSLTVSVTACEKASRWSSALELSKQSINSRVQVDFMAMNSILNVCAGARQWQSCLEMAGASTKEKDPVMTNIISNACAGPWAWNQGMASLEDASHHMNRGLFSTLLAGFSAVMQSLPWLTAVDVLKDLRRCDVELDTMAFSSFLKTLELDGNWRYSLQSLQENDQKQLPPDGLLYNALVSSSEKSSDWKATLSLFTFRLGDFGLDSTSISATVLSCCQSNQWQLALELLHWTSMACCPPTSHALATLISAVEDIPDVEVRVLLMLAHATVDGVTPPSYLLGTLRSALLAAATYRHPLVAKPAFSPGLSAIGSQGLYRYSKELQLLRHVMAGVPGSGPSPASRRVCRAIEAFGAGPSSTKRWLKVAGTQKAKVLEAVIAGVVSSAPTTKILEIGTYCGYSALRMFLHVGNVQIHTLEADPIHAAVACNIFNLAGISPEWIRIHMGHSKTLLPKWPSPAGTSFQAVFMDQRGSRYEEDLHVLEERALLAPGAAVIADNVLKPGAPRFLWKLRSKWRDGDGPDGEMYHLQILSLQEFAMPSEDWMTVSIRIPSHDSESMQAVPEKIQELHYLAEAMRDLASKPGGASVSFDEWKNFALKMKEELKILGIQATAELK